jgi:hypothetical protein
MPGITLAELIAKLSVEGQVEVKTALDQMQVGTEKTAQKFEKLGETISRVGLAVGAYLTAMLYKFGQYSEEMIKVSKLAGTTIEDAQRLAYAAGQEDASVQSLAVAMRNLTKAMSTGIDETGQAVKAFGALGIDVKDKVTKEYRNAVDVMMEVMDKLKGVGDLTQRNIYIQQLFGRSSNDLIKFLGLTSGELKQLMQRYDELGGVVDKQGIAKGKAWADILRDIQVVMRSLGFDIVQTILPTLTIFANIIIDINKYLKQSSGFLKDIIIGLTSSIAIVASLNTVLRLLSINLTMILGMTGVGIVLAGIGVAMTTLISITSNASKEVDKLNKSLEGLPLEDTITRLKGEIALIDLELDIGERTFGVLVNVNTHYLKLMRERKLLNEQVLSLEKQLNYNIPPPPTTPKETKSLEDLIKAIKQEIEQIDLRNVAEEIAKKLHFDLDFLDRQSIGTKREFIKLLDEETSKRKESNTELQKTFNWRKTIAYAEAEAQYRQWLATKKIMDAEEKQLELQKQVKRSLIDTFINVGKQAVDMFANAMVGMLTEGKSAWESFTKSLLTMIETIIAKLAIAATLAGLLTIITGGAGGGFAGIFKTLMGFDQPYNDMWARRQGRDFGYNFKQGMESKVGMPRQEVQPIRIEIHNANPETYVRIFKRLSPSQKQIFYETSVLPGQRRFDQR